MDKLMLLKKNIAKTTESLVKCINIFLTMFCDKNYLTIYLPLNERTLYSFPG